MGGDLDGTKGRLKFEIFQNLSVGCHEKLRMAWHARCVAVHGGLRSYNMRGHGGRVVTLSPPTSEAWVRSPARPQVGKLVVACRWSAVYSTEP